MAARADLKADVLKDLDKQKQLLNAYRATPSIAESVLNTIIQQLDRFHFTGTANQAKAGQTPDRNDWLMSIRSRVGIPMVVPVFDLPPTMPGNTVVRRATPWTTASLGVHPLWRIPSICAAGACARLRFTAKVMAVVAISAKLPQTADRSSCSDWRCRTICI